MLDVVVKVFAVIGVLATVAGPVIAYKIYVLMRRKDERDERQQQPPMHWGLKLLLDAHTHGEQLGKGRWDFAVEIGTLRHAGLTNVDFRWLISKGYVQHAHASSRPGFDDRAFHMVGQAHFSDATCFILTDSGVAYAKDLLESSSQAGDLVSRNGGSR